MAAHHEDDSRSYGWLVEGVVMLVYVLNSIVAIVALTALALVVHGCRR